VIHVDNSVFVCADKIISICEELKALLSVNGAFDAYKANLLGKLQRLSLEIGLDVRTDARLGDIAFITTENGVHVPIKDGKAVGGPMKGMDFSKAESSEGGKKKNVSGHYSSPYPIEQISAEGENKPCKGFSEKGLKRHKEGRHKDQYEHLTDEQYEARARKLLQKKCGEHILGYRCSDGAVCRFNALTGEYAKGYPGGDIKTCFYPTNPYLESTKIDLNYARKYFEARKKEEAYD